MNPPEELSQIDALNSVALNPFIDSLYQTVGSSFDGSVTDNIKHFFLLIPDYAALLMMKIFSFSFVLSLILIFVVIWTSQKILRIQSAMHTRLALPNQPQPVNSKIPPAIGNDKWQRVIIHINSDNPSDWKLAILECDIMLDDILEKMGYNQGTIGDKLKAVEPSDFTNIESAWEAHKIRNAIAHEGSEFLINHREAKRVIGLYEVVFREFAYI
jgi:hypothetical protein